jgi:hypothetical protein
LKNIAQTAVNSKARQNRYSGASVDVSRREIARGFLDKQKSLAIALRRCGGRRGQPGCIRRGHGDSGFMPIKNKVSVAEKQDTAFMADLLMV